MAAPDLVTTADVFAARPDLSAARRADVPALIAAASRACEGYCRRPLALASYDEVHRPGRTRKILLRTWPVAAMQRLKTDLAVVMTVTNADPTLNQAAWARLAPTQLVLSRVASGAAVTNALTLASYATAGALAAAVNALGGGWSAVALSPPAAVSEINPDREAAGALGQAAELRAYARDVGRYTLDAGRGVIELTENRPEAFRYADRAYGVGFGWSWSAAAEPRHAGVRAVYRAGYAVDQADLDAGYDPVPADLRRAVILAVCAGLSATASPELKSESMDRYSYELADPGAFLPPMVRSLLAPYVSTRMGTTRAHA